MVRGQTTTRKAIVSTFQWSAFHTRDALMWSWFNTEIRGWGCLLHPCKLTTAYQQMKPMKDNIQVGLWKFTENETQRDRQRLRSVRILLLCCVVLCCVVLCCVALPSLMYAKHMLYHQVTSSILRDTQRGEGRKGNWKENKNRKQASGFLRIYIYHAQTTFWKTSDPQKNRWETVACDNVSIQVGHRLLNSENKGYL